MNSSLPRLILASGSPRRRTLLSQTGLPFEVCASDADERVSGHPEEMVKTLALRKARAIASARPSCWIIGADTLVSLDGKALGKPASEREAFSMLSSLSGRAHEVYTGVCLLDSDSGKYDLRAFVSHVYFKTVTPEQISAYVATGEPMDKAGAYAIQGGAAPFIDRFEGSYNNIVGFPTDEFLEMYRHFPNLLAR